MKPLLVLLALLAGCGAPPCEDCFELELFQVEDASWVSCCSYERRSQDDSVLIRLTRLDGDEYLAGLGAACDWTQVGQVYEAALVTLDGARVDGVGGFNVPFDAEHTERVVAVDCAPNRPDPQYPAVVLRLLDPDLAAQYDPEGDAGEDASLRIEPVILAD